MVCFRSKELNPHGSQSVSSTEALERAGAGGPGRDLPTPPPTHFQLWGPPHTDITLALLLSLQLCGPPAPSFAVPGRVGVEMVQGHMGRARQGAASSLGAPRASPTHSPQSHTWGIWGPPAHGLFAPDPSLLFPSGCGGKSWEGTLMELPSCLPPSDLTLRVCTL